MSWTSPAAIVVLLPWPWASGQSELAVDDRHGLSPDADHLGLAGLRLDGHLDSTRVVNLHSLFHNEGRRGQLAMRGEVGAAGARGTPGRRVLEPEIRGEPAGVHRGVGGRRLEGERVAHDLLPELGHDALQRPQVRV